MDVRNLKYFVAVAEELNVSRAAVRLGIAQPPLSQQIRQLEAEIGSPLFLRLARGVVLTDAGVQLLSEARAILAKIDEAVLKTRRAAAGELGSVRIGFTGSASFNPFVTGAIRDYRKSYPDVAVELVEEPTANLLQRFKTNNIDAAFIRPIPEEANGLTLWPLLQEEMLVAMPAGHRLAERARITLSSLREESFILYPRTNGRAMFDAIVSACRDAGFDPQIAQGAPQMASTVNLVATGIGVSIVPASMSQLSAQGVLFKKISGPRPTADMFLACQITGVSEVAKQFTELVLKRSPLRLK